MRILAAAYGPRVDPVEVRAEIARLLRPVELGFLRDVADALTGTDPLRSDQRDRGSVVEVIADTTWRFGSGLSLPDPGPDLGDHQPDNERNGQVGDDDRDPEESDGVEDPGDLPRPGSAGQGEVST